MLYSNPRRKAVIENWPSGRKQVTAVFEVESNKKGERICRTTTGKPKTTTYKKKIAIFDGEDGKTYILGLTNHAEMISVYEGTLKYSPETIFPDDERFDQLKTMIETAK